MRQEQAAASCRKIIDNMIAQSNSPKNRLLDMGVWDWSQGVALYGIWKCYKYTGEVQYLAYLQSWFDTKMERPIVHNVNTMAPLLTLCCLYEETKQKKYLDFCVRCADWLLDSIPKTEMGGIQHITVDADNTEQLWADTVFMAVLFLGKIAAITENVAYAGACKKQFLLHIRYLADKDTGLWYHGWSFERRDNYAKAFWARGNCWFTMAASEIVQILPMQSWESELILDAYRAQVKSLLQMQSESGLWHTLVDVSDSYLEVSGSAGFACGIATGIRMQYLPQTARIAVQKAVDAVCAAMDENGVVQQVSYGTIVADNLAYYKEVPLRATGYGQSLALMMLVEFLYSAKKEDNNA